MDKLLCKLQYKNYEPGEFIAEELRSLEDIKQLITTFPWEEQRHFTPVGPTGPSITIEDKSGNYLKFGHSYYEKYCLYMLTSEGKFYKKVVPLIVDGIQLLTSFFNGEDIHGEMEDEFTLQPQRHFITKEFRYNAAYKGMFFSFCCYSLLPLVLLAMNLLLIFGANQANTNKDVPMVGIEILCTIVDAVLIFFTVTAWRLFFNHYHIARNQFIVISKGRNEFIFGTEDNHKTYLKNEISTFKEYRNTQSRSPWARLNYTEITFDDGEQIKISSLLLKYGYAKFPDVKCELVSKFYPEIK